MYEIFTVEARKISMNRMIAGFLFLICLAAPLTGTTKEALKADSTKSESTKGEALLRQLEADFAADVAKHGHEAFITYFADDGVEVVDGGGFNNKEAMRKQPPWPEGTSLTWMPIKAEMAESGDLGYTYGNYIYTAKNKEGKPVTSYGKYTSIWKKQKDGQWKVVVDVGNSSPDPNSKK
jgi:ketosteroid isomerase-like protein